MEAPTIPILRNTVTPSVVVQNNGELVADSGGGRWFTEWGANRVGHVTSGGRSAENGPPTPSSEPHGLAVGANGAVYPAYSSAVLTA